MINLWSMLIQKMMFCLVKPLKNMVLMIFGVSIYHIVPKLNFMSLVSLVMRINIVE